MSEDLYEIEYDCEDGSPPIRYTITASQYEGMVEANRRADEAGQRALQYEQRSEREFGSMFVNGSDYAPHASRLTTWIVDGLLPSSYVAVLGATSKAGKTCFATSLAMSIATGEPFLGRNVLPGAVLWCAYEESETERLKVLEQWPEHPYRFYITHKNPLIDDPEGLKALAYWVYKTDARLIVIDPLYGATNAESLSDGRAARRALAGIKEICRKNRCAALVLHHITKDVSVGMVRERFADSNQILATASMDMLMDSTDLDDGGRLLRISCRGRGDFANQTLFVKSTGVTHFELVEAPLAESLQPTLADGRIIDHLKEANRPMTAKELSDQLHINLLTLRNRLTLLLQKDLIATAGKQDRALLYASRRSSSS